MNWRNVSFFLPLKLALRHFNEKRAIAVGLVTMVIVSSASIVTAPLFLGPAMGSVVESGLTPENSFLFGLAVSLYAVWLLSSVAVGLIAGYQNDQLICSYRGLLFKNWLAEPAEVSNMDSSEASGRMSTDINAVYNSINAIIITLPSAVLQLLGALIVAAWLTVKLFLVLILGVVILGFAFLLFERKLAMLSKAVQNSLVALTKNIFEVVPTKTLFQQFGAIRKESDRFDVLQTHFVKQNQRRRKFNAFTRVTLMLGVAVLIVLMFVFGLQLVRAEEIATSAFMSFIALGVVALFSFIKIVDAFTVMAQAGVAMIRLEQIIDNLRDSSPPQANDRNSHRMSEVNLRCEALSYKIPSGSGDDLVLLNSLSLSLDSGVMLGVAGPSGAGKTSLLGVLSGRLSPTSGRMEFTCGTAAVPPSDITAVAFQETPIFARSLKENLNIGPQELNSQEVETLLSELALSDVVDRMPDGLGTPLVSDVGLLSGGERQRVGIGRALGVDRPVLLLDEVTSALDEATEDIVMAAVRRRCDEGAIAVIVSHRARTLMACDRVILLKDGEIQADGTPEDLLLETHLVHLLN